MKRFVAISHDFDIEITISAIRRVKGVAGIELTDLQGGSPPLVLRLQDELTTLLDAVWPMIEAQALKAGISRAVWEDWTARTPNALTDLEKAFWEELADFFRPCRPAMTRIIENLRQVAVAQPPVTQPVAQPPPAVNQSQAPAGSSLPTASPERSA